MSTSKFIYKRPLIFAIVLHILLFFLLFFHFAPSHNFSQRNLQPDVEIIKATAVSQQSLDGINAEKLKKQQDAEKKQEELKRRQLEKEKAAAEKLAKAKAAELKRKQDEARKVAEAKAAAKKAADEKAAQEKALAQKATEEKAAKLATQQKAIRELEQAQEKAFQERIDKELQDIEAAKSIAKQSEIDRYLAQIQQALENNWNKPANLDPSIYCLLHVQIAPGGVVINVSIAKSSGNPALDNSARTAVFKASPLPVPDDPDLFNAFRQITLKAGAENMSGA